MYLVELVTGGRGRLRSQDDGVLLHSVVLSQNLHHTITRQTKDADAHGPLYCLRREDRIYDSFFSCFDRRSKQRIDSLVGKHRQRWCPFRLGGAAVRSRKSKKQVTG